MKKRVLDSVQDAELQTRFHPESTVHIYTETGPTVRERAILREEHWKRQKFIGGGSFGNVWLERCVQGRREVGLRAVKEVIKSPHDSKQIDYNRELEAISKFSHRNYERCFVKSFGWFENENAIFIAMEYFEHGDLQHYLHSAPPLPESDAQQITFQVLEGLHFMHENDYSHRDLKPGNILVRSKSPDLWWVKLSDFGISKRAADNLAASSTLKGTLRYMAPELLGFVEPGEESDSHNAQAADLWALGEISFQMLTKEPTFKYINLLSTYIRSPDSFPSAALRGYNVSEVAIDFIKSLMQPKPEDRQTTSKALLQAWMLPYNSHTTETSVSTEYVWPTSGK
ncbi:hypothetical protein OEA41_008882 [Lepraria neglecta]|uniref:non-specific serine/threonine protein kinase n=1 Tax=Lepraria neglecta TaxID=209136 RepID=A0AAD9Z0J7_9LECA|nr:hypothetical protein OEA41_008882 [Lepraria neglecta]